MAHRRSSGQVDTSALPMSCWPLVSLVAVAVWIGALAASSEAQTSGSYDLSRNVLATGNSATTAGTQQLGASAGQAAAGPSLSGSLSLNLGFWPMVLIVDSTASPTPTDTRAPSPTPTGVSEPTVTVTLPATAIPTMAPSATATITADATATVTPTSAPSVTATAVAPPCDGDCDGNLMVTVDEILRAVNIALGNVELTQCPAADRNGDELVTVDEILAAVNNALNGCPAG